MINNKISIKKVYLYNNDLYNKVTKGDKKKLLIWVIISLIISLISVFFIVYIIKNNLVKNFLILSFILIVSAIIFIFIFIYKLLLLTSVLSQKSLFSNRIYVITNNNKIISLKYINKYPLFKGNIFDNTLLDEMFKILIYKTSINKDNKEMIKKVNENNIILNDLYEYLEIVNVYEINEENNYIEIRCDFIDLLKNTCIKNNILTIYKYYEEWEDILKSLEIQKDKEKAVLTLPIVEHNNFIKFVLQYSLRKSNAIWFHCFFAFAFISLIHSKNTLAILLEFGIAILLISLYLKIRTLDI